MRIAALGQYRLRLEQPGFHWDSQYLAFEELGHDVLYIDIRYEHDFADLARRVLDFQPELMWIALKDGLPFLIHLNKLKSRDYKTAWWLADLRAPEGLVTRLPVKHPSVNLEAVQGLVDILFLSFTGLLKEYQDAYGISGGYYMPQCFVPGPMRKIDANTRWEVVFAGDLDNSIYHRNRTALIHKIMRKYGTHCRNNARRDLSEFYASGKLVFGATVVGEGPDFEQELYTSARLFYALGCGTCHVCQWFPGIERLVRNHEHAVWFQNEGELFENIDYYLAHDDEREAIRDNALRLSLEKHTHIHRISNMMAIVNGAADRFWGFLDEDSNLNADA